MFFPMSYRFVAFEFMSGSKSNCGPFGVHSKFDKPSPLTFMRSASFPKWKVFKIKRRKEEDQEVPIPPMSAKPIVPGIKAEQPRIKAEQQPRSKAEQYEQVVLANRYV